MNDKEISELRRRFRADRSNITHIAGCYVNDHREILATFDQSMGLMPQEESEKYLALFKRSLSGGLGKNLMDITFSTQQVLDSPEHNLLMALRKSALKDENALQTFYQIVIDAVSLDSNYVILLAYDAYDVPFRTKDGADLDDASETQFTYIVCSICPVKTTKPALSYVSADNLFHNRKLDQIIAPPELGFLFPAFDNRSTNLYNALYYSRNTKEVHESFVDAVFHTVPPMAPAIQKETFQSILAEALEDDCSYDLVQTVHEQLSELIEEHKSSREAEPLTISKHVVEGMLESCGVPKPKVEAFEQKFDAEFGAETDISPRNLIDVRQFEVRTPDVVVKVNPERRELVETRILGGVKYLLIRAEEGVEVNGINVHIPTEDGPN